MAFQFSAAQSVSLRIRAEWIRRFHQLLGQGFYTEVQAGCSLGDLLCNQLGIPRDYLQNRIQTIFLNSKPVDKPEAVTVALGATVALSAAMPGLVGAVMRKGGHYAALRQSISAGTSGECPQAAKGVVTLKLFNMVAAELGPAFLERGIGLEGEAWQDFLDRHTGDLAEGCIAAQIGGKAAGLREMVAMDWRGRSVVLRVVC
jgi:hypothetical protein